MQLILVNEELALRKHASLKGQVHVMDGFT
jgi:hypothetical protein